MRPMRTKTLAGPVAAPMCWNGEEDDEMVKWRSLEGGSTASTDTTTTTTITTFRTGHLEGNAVVSSDVCRIAFTWAICQLSPLEQQKARSLHHRQTSTSGRLIKSSRKSSMSKTKQQMTRYMSGYDFVARQESGNLRQNGNMTQTHTYNGHFFAWLFSLSSVCKCEYLAILKPDSADKTVAAVRRRYWC